MEREIEFKLFKGLFMDNEYRYVFWREKPKNWLGKILIPWRSVRMALKCSDGYTDLFSADDFKKLKEIAKTKSEFKAWKNEQYIIAHKHKTAFNNAWKEAMK